MHIYHLVEPVLTPSMSCTAVWSVALRFYPCSIISGSTPWVKGYKRPVKSKSGGGYGGQMVQTKDFPAGVRDVTKCQSSFALNLCYMHMIHTYVSYGSLIHVQPLHNVTHQFKTSLISRNGVLIAHQYLKSFCVLSQHIFAFCMSFNIVPIKLFSCNSKHHCHRERNVRWAKKYWVGWGGGWVKQTKDFHPGDQGFVSCVKPEVNIDVTHVHSYITHIM